MTSVFFIFLIATVANFLSSLLGLSGGITTTPALMLPFHVDIWYAIGASIVSVIAMSSGAAITCLKDHLTNMRTGIFLEIGTTPGAIIGAFLSGVAGTRYLYLTFDLLVLYPAVMMFRRTGNDFPRNVVAHPVAERLHLNSSYYDRNFDREVSYQVAGIHNGLGMMYVTGTISGLLRIDSSALKVMGANLFMKLPMKVSSTTSNFVIGMTTATSADVYFFRGDINPGTVAPVALDALMGAVVSTRVMQRMEGRVIRPVFVPVLVIVSVQVIAKRVLME